jgi:hypothetical protein
MRHSFHQRKLSAWQQCAFDENRSTNPGPLAEIRRCIAALLNHASSSLLYGDYLHPDALGVMLHSWNKVVMSQHSVGDVGLEQLELELPKYCCKAHVQLCLCEAGIKLATL